MNERNRTNSEIEGRGGGGGVQRLGRRIIKRFNEKYLFSLNEYKNCKRKKQYKYLLSISQDGFTRLGGMSVLRKYLRPER